jgi:hypothetical protein
MFDPQRRTRVDDARTEDRVMALNPNQVSRNFNVPSISQPISDLQSLVTVASQLRQGVESLGGHRGNPLDRAVTLNDLVRLGLVTEGDIGAKLK